MSRALVERIDMAVFAAAPGFARASVRLAGIDPGRAGAQAAALLRQAARAAAARPAGDVPRWAMAYEALGLAAETPSPIEALRAWASAPGGVPIQGAVNDLVHATALRHLVPAAAYDLARVEGDVWLRPSRGIERFEPPLGEACTVPINELVLVDSADAVLARAWHGALGAAALGTAGAADVLVHFDLLPPDGGDEPPLDEAEALGESFARLAGGFFGGEAEHQVLHRGRPRAAWPA